MSPGTERRLEKLEGLLAPKEAVLVWLKEAQAHGSLAGYLESLQHAPNDDFPLYRLGRQAELWARAAHKGESDEQIWTAVRCAVRDASFLYYLISNLNFLIFQEARANGLHIALVASMLSSALSGDSEEEVARAWEQAEAAARTIYCHEGVVKAISRRYFDGADVLFSEAAIQVQDQVQRIEQIGEVLADHDVALAEILKRKTRRRVKTEAEAPRRESLQTQRLQAESGIRALMAVAVDLAKSRALNLIGEQEQGYALLARHVWASPS